MVWDGALIVERRLGGADVHPAIDLHRVDRNDLDIAARFGQRHRYIAFSAGRRAQDDHLGDALT